MHNKCIILTILTPGGTRHGLKRPLPKALVVAVVLHDCLRNFTQAVRGMRILSEVGQSTTQSHIFCLCRLYVGGSWLRTKQANVTRARPTNKQMESMHRNQFRCFLPTSSRVHLLLPSDFCDTADTSWPCRTPHPPLPPTQQTARN